MNLPAKHLYMTVEEYLAFDATSSVKHEFMDGHVFAMSGSTLRHNTIAGNFHSLLKASLGVGPCRVFISDVKVKIASLNCFYYPDITVSCVASSTDATFIENPELIIEVLSPSTAALDRREKLLSYRNLKSLKEYVIVHQSQKHIEVFQKKARNRFGSPAEYNNGYLLLNSFPSPIKIDIDELYNGVNWKENVEQDEHTDWSVPEPVGSYTW